MAADDTDASRIAKQRIRQVFDYLKALNDHRTPSIRRIQEQPWSLWLDNLPDHPAVHLAARTLVRAEGEESALPENDYMLCVRRPALTHAPPPPAAVRDWLMSGWDDPEQPVACLEVRNQQGENGETVTVRFEDEPVRLEALRAWAAKRDQWSEAEIPARLSMRLFEKLYALYGRLERDSELYELVVGDGILDWPRGDSGIYHPLLIQRAQLVFDAQIPEFRVVDSEAPSEFCTSLFQEIDDLDARALHARRAEYEQGGYHPLSVEVAAFLEALANQISSDGRFIGRARPKEGDGPAIGRAPVLFLRSRSKGFGTAIEAVLSSIASRDDFPEALKNIVGIDTFSQNDADNVAVPRDSLGEDVLFGKPANPEQIRMARQLGRHGSVLVQGPPGTGKSHTIANLIGHLLANGKSVLVTSHTNKALRVLRGHVVEELRPLCVSVLDSDLDSRDELKGSIHAIGSRLSESDADQLAEEATLLGRRREELFKQLNQYQRQALLAREAEYREIVLGGTATSPSDAARQVATGRRKHDWIPSPVALGQPLPLSESEVTELYATNEQVSADDERYVDEAILLDDIPNPDEFERLLIEARNLAAEGQIDRRLWPDVQFTSGHIERLTRLSQTFRDCIAEFNGLSEWEVAAVDAGRRGGRSSETWKHLLGKINETADLASSGQITGIQFAPQLLDITDAAAQLTVAREIYDHLSLGGSLSWWCLLTHREWSRRLSRWTVNGRLPRTADEVTVVQQTLEVEVARDELRLLWDGLISASGGPSSRVLGEQPEDNAAQFVDRIRTALEWWSSRLQPLIAEIVQVGFDWNRFVTEVPAQLDRFGAIFQVTRGIETRLIQILDATVNHLRALYIRRQLRDPLPRFAGHTRPEVVGLRNAIQESDAISFRECFARCQAAADRRKLAIRRRELLGALERRGASASPIAEAWARSIRERVGIHAHGKPPGDPAKAWEWRQLNDELDRRATLDLDKLSAAIEQIKDEIGETTNQLIDRRAWAAQLRHTSLEQRQSLVGWLQTIQRIGKGFGSQVGLLRREAQKLMEKCRPAVPVWIMPLARIAECFDFSAPRFDVVIIDEASQCDAMALLAVTIAKQVVVVGDDKQVSPLAVGQSLEKVAALIRLHLPGIPNNHLYDGRMSVYDLAQQAFGGVIPLSEHFRCVPDIIQFSQYLSYYPKPGLKPLREAASSALVPHVVPYRVEGSYDSRTKTNDDEASAIASLIAAAIEHDAYVNKSFGVISLLGDEQAIEIERLLLRHLSPEEYRGRRIICGNAAQFQGDERDVMFLSVVRSPEDGPLRLSNDPKTQQRFNVAASRARDQMWVVYSLDPAIDLKPDDLRRRLIEHALDPRAIARMLETESPRTESPFEREVLKRLVARGYRVRPQWEVGRYRIDLVVMGGGKRLAVECDGDRYHPIEKLPEDMERQAILERLGWRFVRLRGSAFHRDPDAAMEKVFARLSELEIPPEGLCQDETPTASGSEVVEQLMRRAAEIRDQWRTIDAESGISSDHGAEEGAAGSCGRGNDHIDASAATARTTTEPVDSRCTVVVAEKEATSPRDARIEIWQMTRGDYHRQKEKELSPDQIDRQAINREFAAAIRQAVSEGRDVPDATLRELRIARP